MYNRSLTQSIILFVPVILVGLGIMMIYSASSIFAAERYHDGMYFLKKQALFGLCGIGCMLIMMRVPYSFLKRCAYPLWLLTLGLLALVLLSMMPAAARADAPVRVLPADVAVVVNRWLGEPETRSAVPEGWEIAGVAAHARAIEVRLHGPAGAWASRRRTVRSSRSPTISGRQTLCPWRGWARWGWPWAPGARCW